MKPAQNMHQQMDHIDKHKRVEKDQVQGKGKAKVYTPERRDPRPDRYGLNWLRIDFFSQPPYSKTPMVNSVFKETIYKVLEKIKNILTSNGPIRWWGPLQKESEPV